MESAPRVNVIMAVFNGEQYLQEAIESILRQTFDNFEFVIIDDGSTDKTVEILNRFSDERIKRLTNESNIGLTRSLNRGIRFSRGEYIVRQDADDVSLPERLAKQVAYLDAHSMVGLVGTSAYYLDVQAGKQMEWIPRQDPVEIHKMLLCGIPFRHGTFMFRRKCLEETGGGYDESMPVAQDCDLLLHISERWDLANLPDILYIHRIHSRAITAGRNSEQVRYLHQTQTEACKRRLHYGWARLGISRHPAAVWVKDADQRWLAQRFLWWSGSSKGLNRWWALQFLIISMILDPLSTELHVDVKNIIARKLGLFHIDLL